MECCGTETGFNTSIVQRMLVSNGAVVCDHATGSACATGVANATCSVSLENEGEGCSWPVCLLKHDTVTKRGGIKPSVN